MDCDDKISVSPEDLLIIEGVENQPLLYDNNAFTCMGYAYSDIKTYKSLAYQKISKEILKKMDKEITEDEVKTRWSSIRSGYCRAIRNGTSYYLQEYLLFLKPFIRQNFRPKRCGLLPSEKIYNNKKYVNSSENNKENNDGNSKDQCSIKRKQNINYTQKPYEPIPLKPSQNCNKNIEVDAAYGNEEEDVFSDAHVCDPCDLPCNKELNTSESTYAWKLLNETSFFAELEQKRSSLPEEEFFPCLSDIFNLI